MSLNASFLLSQISRRRCLVPRKRHLDVWNHGRLQPMSSYAAATLLSLSRPPAPALFSLGWQQHRFWNTECARLLSTHASSNTGSSALWISPPRRGSGFDNFLPKDPKDKGNARSDGGNSGSNGGENGGGNQNGPSSLLQLAVVFMTLLTAYTVLRQEDYKMENDKQEQLSSKDNVDLFSSRELYWHDFLRLLRQQDVVKIEIDSSHETARVYVRVNAIGLHGHNNHGLEQQAPYDQDPAMNNNTSIYTPPGSSRSLSYEERRRRQQAAAAAAAAHDNNTQNTSAVAHTKDDVSSQNSFSNEFGDNSDGHFSNAISGSTPLSATPRASPRFYTMQIGSVDSFERKLDEAQRALGRDPAFDVRVQYVDGQKMSSLVGLFAPILFASIMFVFLTGRGISRGAGGGGGGSGGIGGLFQVGKSTAKRIAKEDISTTFADVAGCDEAKKEILEFVDFLKDSERFTKLGAKIPKGALLCGPPGTGKTLLAKAVAGEAGVPFYSISGSDFIEMFVGVGPSRVRDLFAEARKNAPCIVFIDEIDAVGRQRGRAGIGGNDERENTLNQLLVEMDGFEPSTNVVVLAGTNRVDILDDALTRPGRFDRQITIDKPDLKGRKAIFEVHLKGIKLADNVEDIAGRLAGLTPGFAGADISNICNEAAIVAARRKGETVTLNDFEKATDRVIGGLESSKIMSKEERSIVAHHEAGHAIAGWFLEHADPLMKVTIIPRSGGALGFAQYLPKEVSLRTIDQIMDIVCMALAGRAAEDIFFGRVTTGASDDLKRVTSLVYSTIQLYGMNSRLGQLSFPKDPDAFFDDRPYSQKTAKAMDEEARRLVDEAYQRSLALLREKKNQVEAVAKMLLDKETITHDDIEDIIGPRPFEGDSAYKEFVQRRKTILQPENKNKKEGQEEGNTDNGNTNDHVNPGLA